MIKHIPTVDLADLAVTLSTHTVDLSLPNEPEKWGHLSYESAMKLAVAVDAWLSCSEYALVALGREVAEDD